MITRNALSHRNRKVWQSGTYGNNMFVIISNTLGNMSAYSTDGINWTLMNLPSSQNWSAITYGNNKFVAVSGDGIKWTAATLPNAGAWNSITYGESTFLAIGSDIGAYSTNGENWTQINLPESSSQWGASAYGNGRFVVLSGGRGNSAATIRGSSLNTFNIHLN